MNERIKELVRQAGVTWLDGNPHGVNHYYITSEQQMEKFAELIVQECIAAIESRAVEKPMSEYYIKQIEEHFGVEE